MRAFDVSEFSGSVVFVSAYRKEKSSKSIRIAIQLRDNARSLLKKRGNKLILSVENRFGVFSKSQLDQQKVADARKSELDEEAATNIHVPKSNAVQDILENLTLS
jgi:type IV pilus assembly protein PilQ